MATHPGGLTAAETGTGAGVAAPAGAVRVRGLRRRFGARTVLDGLDLDIGAGEFVALLGRSGSGKSTLLRAIAGLPGGEAERSRRSSGSASAGSVGLPGGEAERSRRSSGPASAGSAGLPGGVDPDLPGDGLIEVPENSAVVFQDARLLPWQRVLTNVVLGLRGPDVAARGRAALAEVGLADRERAWPNQLSGGEQQRVALARALVSEPALLLADEPFGALDALTRIRMHELLRRLCARHRPAVLLVTHDVDEAISLADRVLLLDGGRIIVDQAIDLPAPRSYRHPGFLNHRNLLLEALGVRAPEA